MALKCSRWQHQPVILKPAAVRAGGLLLFCSVRAKSLKGNLDGLDFNYDVKKSVYVSLALFRQSQDTHMDGSKWRDRLHM